MTACLQAVSVGCAVPRLNFEGAVHSVFESAVNLQLPGDGMLLTLLCGQTDLPQGIRLEGLEGFTFQGLSVGARATCRGSMLTVGNALTVDLRAGRTYACDLSSLGTDVRRSSVAAAWQYAWDALGERLKRSGSAIVGVGMDQGSSPQSLMLQQLDRALRQIVRAARRYDLAGMGKLGGLVGLGSGLTPSGDDLLTGYLAGLWCASRKKPERLSFLTSVGQLVLALSARTNDISRTYLCHAASGQVSSRLVDLATEISAGADRPHVSACAEAAMRVGHSSGMETVNGLLLGLAAWDGSRLVA